MKAIDINHTLIEGYLKMLNNLSVPNKRRIISELSASIKANKPNRDIAFYEAFGAWKSKKNPEQIIQEIRSNRAFTRKIEPF